MVYSKYKTISDHESKYTNKKYNALREHLLKQKTITIKPVKVEPLIKIETYLRQKDESTQISQNDVFTNEKTPPKEAFSVSQTFTPISNTSTTMSTLKPADPQKIVNPSFMKGSDQSSVLIKPIISENSQLGSFSNFTIPAKSVGNEISKPISQAPINQVSTLNIGSLGIECSEKSFDGKPICSPNLKSGFYFS